VAERLRKSGVEFHCFTQRQGNTQPDAGSCLPMNYLDATDIRKRIADIGLPEVFIHIGWGDMDKPESSTHLSENVSAGRTLISTLFEAGLKTFLFVGSMNEYGGRIGSLSEDMEPEGRLTNYAKGKIEVGKFGFQSAREHGATFLHARTFYVYGGGQRKGSLINDLYQAYREGKEVSLSPCEHYRDYIHVAEVAEGLLKLTSVDQSATVNLGSGRAIKVKDFVLLLWNELGGDAANLKFGARQLRQDEPEQPKSYADLRLLKDLTQWTPALSLEEGIELTVKELRAAQFKS
jgi:nucleoside-diphosphate-sugar epimerase